MSFPMQPNGFGGGLQAFLQELKFQIRKSTNLQKESKIPIFQGSKEAIAILKILEF